VPLFGQVCAAQAYSAVSIWARWSLPE
jgi:hypothetical protein